MKHIEKKGDTPTMRSKRFLATIPTNVADELARFAAEQNIYASQVVQRSVTKLSETSPTDQDVIYVRGETTGIQLSFSDTAYRLLELWSKQTKLSKSKLITYSLQETLLKGERI